MNDYLYKFLKFTVVFIIVASSNTIIAIFLKDKNSYYVIYSGIFNFFIYLVLRITLRKKYNKYGIKFNYIYFFTYILLVSIFLLKSSPLR